MDDMDLDFPGVDVDNPEETEERIEHFIEKNKVASKKVEDAKTVSKIFGVAAGGLVVVGVAGLAAPIVGVGGALPLITTASKDAILVKMITSASTQYVLSGSVDGIDVVVDGLLINGAGTVVGAYADFDISTGEFQAFGFGKEGSSTLIDLGVGSFGDLLGSAGSKLKTDEVDLGRVGEALKELTLGGTINLTLGATNQELNRVTNED